MLIKETEFHGLILKDKDSKLQGRYLVHIPELHHLIKENIGIWCKNHIHKNRYTDSDDGKYGSYSPLHMGTKVIIKFYENDLNTGYIDRIISDQKHDALPFKSSDRDDLYLLVRTPKYDNIVLICEDTIDQPPNSLHILFNQYNSMLVIDGEGIHIYTNKDYNMTIDRDHDIKISGDSRIKIDGKSSLVVTGDANIVSSANCNLKATGNCNIQASGSVHVKGVICNIEGTSTVNVRGSSMIAMDAAMIYLNGGLSSPASPVESSDEVQAPSFNPSNQQSTKTEISIPIIEE